MFDVAVWGTVAEWFAAIGTLGAVITSLWLALRTNKERLRVRILAGYGWDEKTWKPRTQVVVSVANIGAIPVTIVGLVWRTPSPRPMADTYSRPQHTAGTKLPARLEPGQSTRYWFSAEDHEYLLGKLVDAPRRRRWFRFLPPPAVPGVLLVETARGTVVKCPLRVFMGFDGPDEIPDAFEAYES